ncbi:hypothetical protein E4U53_005952 [Claviceps sorghi]|nr:hypothetical protein E4U53_005952 [Claviceps sorghi]
MSSSPASVTSQVSSREDEQPAGDDTVTLSDIEQRPPSHDDDDHQGILLDEALNGNGTGNGTGKSAAASSRMTSPPPAEVPPFNWEQFEARYESALKEADEEERDILQEAQSLSKHELVTFDQIHFSNDAVAKFATEFTNLPLKNEGACLYESHDWQEEDDLGFYYDGVKRTLTDEQIAIFRHSELRELEKRQNKAKVKASGSSAGAETPDAQRNGSAEGSSQGVRSHSNRGVRKKKKKGGRSVVHEPKPDLRKRTWDVVDAGLDSLDYD